MSDATGLAVMYRRIRAHNQFLLQVDGGRCFREQKHTEEGSQERIYWHYGYMVALRDVLRFLGHAVDECPALADAIRVADQLFAAIDDLGDMREAVGEWREAAGKLLEEK